ncbi:MULTISPECIES: flavodoxin domain-containing protein [unclassified Fusibacter]|uniref:flavodoxin domain-containing protein n=1 Tax=unclassified Fusibacter TaxID=2624464 RepID=UPI0010106297|nr:MULTISPECIES: flavodoxin domain-containing protein [unclassified Fusibacter]MCK8060378.1 flavodoxin domain-containing protein [Fusibacter sp. A2]NPE20333.1 hypothetical protein [Fusibacter sp. A1]RXV63539.1 hypothetical protein DWB64_00775 [Fusibacter sp. A1]
MSKVLIGYVTKTGSTREVAQRINEILTNKGHTVEIRQLDEVKDFKGFDSIIIGAPINGMNWRQDAYEFVNTHKAELSNVKVAYFALGIMAYQGRKLWNKTVNKALVKPSSIVEPIDTAVFGGVSGDVMPAPVRFIFGIPKDSKADQRDWTKIEEWADGLCSKL